MSREHTNLLKGFAILTVLWGHSGLSYGIHSLQWIAAIGVSLFLICSGYGLEASFEKNELKNYWIKRIVAVLIPYWIVYTIAATVMSSKLSFSSVLQVLLFSNANWYIPFILIVYIIYWLIKLLTIRFKLNRVIFYSLLFFSFSIWFVIISYYFINPSAPSLLARQIFAFPLGVVLYDHRVAGRRLFTSTTFKSKLSFIGVGILGLILTFYANINSNLLPNIFNNILSVFTIIPLAIVTLRISCIVYNLFSNKLFKFMGLISYEVYLIQYFVRSIINQNPLSLYYCFFLTIILSLFLYLLYNPLSKKILNHLISLTNRVNHSVK